MNDYPIASPEQRQREKNFDVGLNEDSVGLRPNEIEPPAAAAEDEFGLTDRLADAGKGVAQGANQLAQGVFDIWKNTGGYVNKALASPLNGASTLSRALGNDKTADLFDRINLFNDNAEWFDKGEAENLALTQIFADNNAIYEDSKSEHFKERKAALEEDIENAEGQVEKAYLTFMGNLTDPSLAVDFLAKQIPMLTGLGAVGRAGQGFAAARGLSATAAGKVGTSTAVGVGGALQGGSVASETYENVLEQSPELWAVNDKYIELLNSGLDEDTARNTIANDLRQSTFLGATAVSVLANMLPGARALERSLVGVKLAPGVAVGAAQRAGRAALGGVGEGLSEAIEEGGGQLLGNAAVKTVNREQELSEGVGRAAGEAALAFIPGAAGGALQRVESSEEGEVTVNVKTPAGETSYTGSPQSAEKYKEDTKEAYKDADIEIDGESFPAETSQKDGDVIEGEVISSETSPIETDTQEDGEVSEGENEYHPESTTETVGGKERTIGRGETTPENYNGENRRKNLKRRDEVSKMSPDEVVDVVYRNELSGSLNRRAFNEDVKNAKRVTSVDLDALKASNDYASPKAGDQLLKNAAEAFRKVFGDDSYHISGDEFYILDAPSDLDAKMEEVRSILAESRIEDTKNGKRVVIEGGDFSYGTADNKDAADSAMKDAKIQREKDGKRVARKDLPKNIKYYDADGKQLSARLNEAGELQFDGDTTATTKEKSNVRQQENGSINDQKRNDGRQGQGNEGQQESPETRKPENVEGDGKKSGIGKNPKGELPRSDGQRQREDERKSSVEEERDSNEDVPQVAARAKLDARERSKPEHGQQKVRLTELADQHDTQESFEKAVRAELGPGAFNKFKILGDLNKTYKERDPARHAAKQKADAKKAEADAKAKADADTKQKAETKKKETLKQKVEALSLIHI